MSKLPRGRPPKRTSPLSAAIVIYAWTIEHKRPPKACECRPCNGLMHWQTYYEIFQMNNFSAGIMPMVSSLVSGLRMKACLGNLPNGKECGKPILDEGKHIRMCDSCRNRYSNEEREYGITMEQPSLTLSEYIGRGWSRYESWVEDVDWGQEERATRENITSKWETELTRRLFKR